MGLLRWVKKRSRAAVNLQTAFSWDIQLESLVIIYLLPCQPRWAEFSSRSGFTLGALGTIFSPWPVCTRFTLDEKQTATLRFLLFFRLSSVNQDLPCHPWDPCRLWSQGIHPLPEKDRKKNNPLTVLLSLMYVFLISNTALFKYSTKVSIGFIKATNSCQLVIVSSCNNTGT